MSKIKVNEIEKASGSGITVPTGTSFTITDGLAVSSLPTVTVPKGGTNLTSFTAGDLLYATGSTTLAKLPKGTASQQLRMNSGATAPEWATVSGGDYVKLASADSTSGEVSFDGFFTSDYKVYDVIVHMCISDGTNWSKIFVNSGGSKVTASNYRLVASGGSRDSSADANIKYSKWNEAYGIAHYWGGPAKISCRIFNPLDTTTEKFIHIESNSYQSDTKLWRENIVNVYHSDAAISGVTFGSSGTLGIFQATLYGLKA